MSVAVVVGVGPGLGYSLAKRFAKEGFSVALVARSAEKLKTLQSTLLKACPDVKVESFPTDVTKEDQIKATFDNIKKSLGQPSVLLYNAGDFIFKSLKDVSAVEMTKSFNISCLGAMLCMQQVLDDMIAKKKGTILFTGATASLRGSAKFSVLAVSKFALRALAQSAAREFGPQGIHVGHVIIDGQIGDSAEKLKPSSIADSYWMLHSQSKDAWTFEMDLRPHTEKW